MRKFCRTGWIRLRCTASKPARRGSCKANCAPACHGGGFGGTELSGATLEGTQRGGGTARYEIARVVPGTVWLYELRFRDARGAWKSFCGPDAEGERLAIPLQGTYDAKNTAQPDPRRITFACTRGVMAKCYRWGYRPWLGAHQAAAHQACIRMAMADYCGDGRSWTRDGTTIKHWDRLQPPVQPDDAAPAGFEFEAAWTPRGAACLARPRWSGLAENFSPGSCTPALPACASEEEAVRRFGHEVILFNASARNVAR